MDDVNNMDESMDMLEQSPGPLAKALGTGLDRRTMLKAAVAAGAIAGTWVAPRIETLGFTPAGATSATPCIILSPESDDKNSQSGQNYCPVPPPPQPPPGRPCCGQSFGNAGQIDRFTFVNPAPNCTQIVVRTIALNCNPAGTQPERNPDVGQFAVIIESTSGSGCGVCQILDAVIISSSGRQPMTNLGTPPGSVSPFRNNGPISCPGAGTPGTGVDASLFTATGGCVTIPSSARLAVRLTCNLTPEACPPS